MLQLAGCKRSRREWVKVIAELIEECLLWGSFNFHDVKTPSTTKKEDGPPCSLKHPSPMHPATCYNYCLSFAFAFLSMTRHCYLHKLCYNFHYATSYGFLALYFFTQMINLLWSRRVWKKKVLSMDSISFHLDTTQKKNTIHLVPFKHWVEIQISAVYSRVWHRSSIKVIYLYKPQIER